MITEEKEQKCGNCEHFQSVGLGCEGICVVGCDTPKQAEGRILLAASKVKRQTKLDELMAIFKSIVVTYSLDEINAITQLLEAEVSKATLGWHNHTCTLDELDTGDGITNTDAGDDVLNITGKGWTTALYKTIKDQRGNST